MEPTGVQWRRLVSLQKHGRNGRGVLRCAVIDGCIVRVKSSGSGMSWWVDVYGVGRVAVGDGEGGGPREWNRGQAQQS